MSEWWVVAFVVFVVMLGGFARLPVLRGRLDAIKPYTQKETLAAFALGISSGFPFSMIGATLASRLAQSGIDKKTVTAFALAILVYNFKWLWAWIIEGVRIPVLGRLGQRVSWMLVAGVLVILAVLNLARVDPAASLGATISAAILIGFAGATFDIVIDAYRIETLKPEQLGVGSGMTQYGWRIGSVAAGGLALVVAQSAGWSVAYAVCAIFALPAMITAVLLGEPARHCEPSVYRDMSNVVSSIIGPFLEFFRRRGAWLVLAFILLHKIGDTLGQLVVRLLYNDLGYSNTEIALYDVGVGFWAYLVGVFVGGIIYERLGMKVSVLLSLLLMGVSNASYAGLAVIGHSNLAMAATQGFENFASGIGGVTVIAYFSALTDLRYTAAQYALISAASSIVGRILTGTTAGALVEGMGYVNFYLLTTAAALPGILLFGWMMRAGLVESSIGSAGTTPSADDPDGDGQRPSRAGAP